MADSVCAKVNQTDADDKSACKTFLRQRLDMIWQEALWKDSLFEYTQSLSSSGYLAYSSTWLPAKKILLLPKAIEHVLAARSDSRKFDIESSEAFYRVDYDAFAGSGVAATYRQLSSCVWEFDTGSEQAFWAGQPANPANVGLNFSLEYVDRDNVTVFESPGQLQAVAAPLTASAARLNSWSFASTLTQFLQDANGNLIGNTTTGRFARRQRIQLIGTVPDPAVIRVLGKIYAPTLTNDADEPALTGCTQCLLAFAQGDMLERERQYGKAQQKFTEGGLLLQQMKALYAVQEAQNRRIIPESGYGDEIFGGAPAWGFSF